MPAIIPRSGVGTEWPLQASLCKLNGPGAPGHPAATLCSAQALGDVGPRESAGATLLYSYPTQVTTAPGARSHVFLVVKAAARRLWPHRKHCSRLQARLLALPQQRRATSQCAGFSPWPLQRLPLPDRLGPAMQHCSAQQHTTTQLGLPHCISQAPGAAWEPPRCFAAALLHKTPSKARSRTRRRPRPTARSCRRLASRPASPPCWAGGLHCAGRGWWACAAGTAGDSKHSSCGARPSRQAIALHFSAFGPLVSLMCFKRHPDQSWAWLDVLRADGAGGGRSVARRPPPGTRGQSPAASLSRCPGAGYGVCRRWSRALHVLQRAPAGRRQSNKVPPTPPHPTPLPAPPHALSKTTLWEDDSPGDTGWS